MSCSSNPNKKEVDKIKPFTYLALGDSYTIGESVLETNRWPNQLVKKLNDTGLMVDDAKILAKTGWTTDELSQAINDSTLSKTYDLVSLLIGVNNQYRGRSVENFREEFKNLLETAIYFSGDNNAKVFVLSIPDWGVTPFAEDRNSTKIATEIDQFNAVIKQECKSKSILFIDITDISRLVEERSGLIAEDGLHPSGKMYGLWVNRVFPEIYEKLK